MTLRNLLNLLEIYFLICNLVVLIRHYLTGLYENQMDRMCREGLSGQAALGPNRGSILLRGVAWARY